VKGRQELLRLSKVVKIAWMALFVVIQLVDIAVLDPVAYGQARTLVPASTMTVQTAAKPSSSLPGQLGGGLVKGEVHDGCHGLHLMALPAGAAAAIDIISSARDRLSRHRRVAEAIFAPPVPPPNS